MLKLPKIVEESTELIILKLVGVLIICASVLYIIYICKYRDDCIKLSNISCSREENLNKYLVNVYSQDARYVHLDNFFGNMEVILNFEGSNKKYMVDQENKTIDIGKPVLLRRVILPSNVNNNEVRVTIRNSSGINLYITNL
jgi:hypothetical protein